MNEIKLTDIKIKHNIKDPALSSLQGIKRCKVIVIEKIRKLPSSNNPMDRKKNVNM